MSQRDLTAHKPSLRLSPEAIERWRNPPAPAAKTEVQLRIEATVDAIMEESRIANSEFQEEYARRALTDAQWMVNAHRRAAKKVKAATPEGKAAKALKAAKRAADRAAKEKEEVTRLLPIVSAACVRARCHNAQGTYDCAKTVQPFLPEGEEVKIRLLMKVLSALRRLKQNVRNGSL